MRILRIVASMAPEAGGVAEAIKLISNETINDSNLTMDILTLDNAEELVSVNISGAKLIPIGSGKTAYKFNVKLLSWVYENSESYDLVIIDGIWQFHVLAGFLLKWKKVPYCVYTHGMLDPYFNKDRLKFLKKLPFWLAFERNVIKNADATILTCKDEEYLAAQSFPFYSSNPYIMPLGVIENNSDADKLKQTFNNKFPHLESKKKILFLSRIDKKKGLDLLLTAFANIKSLPDDAVIVIAGPDSSNLKRKLEELAMKLGITKKVHWLGMLEGDLKYGAFKTAEVFILPSHQENFGIVVAESLSMGTPVLITDKVNIWREVVDCNAGFVNKDNIEGVSKLLINWFELSEDNKNIYKLNSIRCFNNKFSVKSAYRKFVTTIEKIINETKISKS